MRCFSFCSFGRDFLSFVGGPASARRVGRALRAARVRFPAGRVVRGSDGAGWMFVVPGLDFRGAPCEFTLLMWEAC